MTLAKKKKSKNQRELVQLFPMGLCTMEKKEGFAERKVLGV